MMRHVILGGTLMLAACTNEGTNPIVGRAVEEIGGLLPGSEATPAEAPSGAAPLTRAQIEAADIAAIWARLAGDQAPSLLQAQSLNGPFVTYSSAFGQSVVMRGGKVTGTRGLGTDLLAAWSSAFDPVVVQTPLARWPERVTRSYEFPAEGPEGRIETYECYFEAPGPLRRQVILERAYEGRDVAEICTGPAGEMENLYFAAPGGFIWRSLQWTGPDVAPLEVQVLEPYTGN